MTLCTTRNIGVDGLIDTLASLLRVSWPSSPSSSLACPVEEASDVSDEPTVDEVVEDEPAVVVDALDKTDVENVDEGWVVVLCELAFAPPEPSKEEDETVLLETAWADIVELPTAAEGELDGLLNPGARASLSLRLQPVLATISAGHATNSKSALIDQS
ncbi:MAG: hypothetical protein M1835_002781 [Candelina submexicana]|nr:MAG: hypothetical protein M1835_002781 [Candelina submexicana]